MIHQIGQQGGGVQDPLPGPQPRLAGSTKSILRDPVWQLHDPASAVGVPLVHAAEKVAKRMIGIAGIVFVHPVDRACDLGDSHSFLPHLGNPLIRKRSILAPYLALEPLRFRLVSASWCVLHCCSPLGIESEQLIMSYY